MSVPLDVISSTLRAFTCCRKNGLYGTRTRDCGSMARLLMKTLSTRTATKRAIQRGLSDPVRKVSIIPRGMALGVTFSAPDSDRFNYQQPEVIARIKVALGGRSAEELVYGEISTGAESDIEQLTAIARQMVGRWGMSGAIGPISVLPRDGSGSFLPGSAEVSPETQRVLDEEVRRIVTDAHEEVLALLGENRGRLDSLAEALLEHETLDEADVYAAAGVTRPQALPAEELAAAARSTK